MAVQKQQKFQSACGQVVQIYNCLIDHFMVLPDTIIQLQHSQNLLLKSYKKSAKQGFNYS